MPRLKEKKIMREKIISILSELRPEFDFSEPVNFIEEGMLDSFDIVTKMPLNVTVITALK